MRLIILIYIFLAIIMASCEKKQAAEKMKAPLPSIVVKEVFDSSQNCISDSSNCTYVLIEYAEFTDSTKAHLKQIISKKLKASASDYIREETVEGTLEHIAQSFIHDYESFRIDFPEYQFGWYVHLIAEIIYESLDIISFRVAAESFTGGAHPNSSVNYFIVDAHTSKILKMQDIIGDTSQFKLLLEREFRSEKGMEAQQSFADMGYFINDRDFLLNNNIGLANNSVIVQFNPYEIAPYSEGATTLELSKEDLGNILRIK